MSDKRNSRFENESWDDPIGKPPKGSRRITIRYDANNNPTVWWTEMHGEADRELVAEPMPEEVQKDIFSFIGKTKQDHILNLDSKILVRDDVAKYVANKYFAFFDNL